MKKIDKRAIEFALWIEENMWTLTFQDVNNDGRTWTNYDDENGLLEYETSIRYTIEEIYNDFLINTDKK